MIIPSAVRTSQHMQRSSTKFYHACSSLTNQVARLEVSKSLIHLVIGV